MTDSSLRTAIARALLASNGETDCDHCYGLALRDADAVLKVLAYPPDEVVERAADLYVRSDFGCQCASCADTAKEHVLGVLAALVGGEQS